MKLSKCLFILPNGKTCRRKTLTHKYICDEHAEEQETKPYGRYCEFCSIDSFNELKHKKDCDN